MDYHLPYFSSRRVCYFLELFSDYHRPKSNCDESPLADIASSIMRDIGKQLLFQNPLVILQQKTIFQKQFKKQFV